MLDQLDKKRAARPIYEYTLPAEFVALEDDYVKKSIGLVKLDMDEEIKATANIKGNQARLAYNFALLALVEVDGRPVNKGEGEEETILRNTDPVIRELILTAYTDMSTASEGATKKFLASKKIKV